MIYLIEEILEDDCIPSMGEAVPRVEARWWIAASALTVGFCCCLQVRCTFCD